MKKILCFSMIALSIVACKKKESNNHYYPYPPYIPTNAVLYNQSLDSIKYYTNGGWRLLEIKGGLAGTTEYYYNTYLNFNNDSVLWVNDTSSIRYRISNIREASTWDSTFLLYRADGSASNGIVLERIINDTLYMEDNVVDGYTYILRKIVPLY